MLRIHKWFAKISSKFSCFRFQPRLNIHIFMKGCDILSLKMTFININNTQFEAYLYLSSDNIGQIWICPATTISFSLIMLTSLFCLL